MAGRISFSPQNLKKLYIILQDQRLCITCLSKKVPATKLFADGDPEALSRQDFRKLCKEINEVTVITYRFLSKGEQSQLINLLNDKRIHKHKVFGPVHSAILENVRNNQQLSMDDISTAKQVLKSFFIALRFDV